MAGSKSKSKKEEKKEVEKPITDVSEVDMTQKLPENLPVDEPEDKITMTLDEFASIKTEPRDKLLLASMRVTHGNAKLNKAAWEDALHTSANREVK